MTSYKKALLIIGSLPILTVTFISIMNVNKTTKLKLLTYTSAPINLGVLMLVSSSGSALLTNILLKKSNQTDQTIRREVHFSPNQPDLLKDELELEELDINQNDYNANEFNQILAKRDPRDPTPTISVPYRIIEVPTSIYNNHEDILEEDIIEEQIFDDKNISRKESETINDLNKNYEKDGWGIEYGENW